MTSHAPLQPMMFRGTLLGVCVVFVAMSGCGPTGPATYGVVGTVTWKGEPLAKGDIVLEAGDGAMAPSAGKIVAGEFKLPSTAGKKRVRITASRNTEKFDPVMNRAIPEQFLPARYNSETTLEAEVTPAGPNRFTFTLTE